MSVVLEDLKLALTEWRRLTDAEGQAIRAGNWMLVAECQNALAKLRSRIDRLSPSDTPATPQSGTKPLRLSPDLRGSILELIELQRQNLASLQERRRRLSEHVENLTSAGRNLRSIQRSYSTRAAGSFSSYS